MPWWIMHNETKKMYYGKQIGFSFMWTLTRSVKVTVLILNSTIKHGIVNILSTFFLCNVFRNAHAFFPITEEEVHYLKREDE